MSPDGTVVPDVKRKLPGRGVWVTATREALTTAVSRNAFARGFKSPVRGGPGLVEMTDHLLERAALDALSMAHKAGLVEIGFGRVEGALAKHDIAALMHARGRRQGRYAEACCGCETAARRGCRDANCRWVHLRAIGFGIGPVKCGTCSAARRPCKRGVSRALSRPPTVSEVRGLKLGTARGADHCGPPDFSNSALRVRGGVRKRCAASPWQA